MIDAKKITEYFKVLAPFDHALDFDNVGLLCGNGKQEIKRVLIALDITMETAKKAADLGADMIISHHPLIFTPLKRLGEGEHTGGIAAFLVEHRIAALCLHTNLDCAKDGVSDLLAKKIGLGNIQPLGADGPVERFVKLRVFAPISYRMRIINAMTTAGAGVYGDYKGSCYTSMGAGTFIPGEGSKPFVGVPSERSWGQEMAIEMICRTRDMEAVISAMRQVHPYEEPAFDAFDIHYPVERYGYAKIGELAEKMDAKAFGLYLKECLGLPGVRCSLEDRPVRKVAVLPGAAGDYWEEAVDEGADCVVIGEIKHDEWLSLTAEGVSVFDLGHDQSEKHICDWLLEQMETAFPEIAASIEDAEPKKRIYL